MTAAHFLQTNSPRVSPPLHQPPVKLGTAVLIPLPPLVVQAMLQTQLLEHPSVFVVGEVLSPCCWKPLLRQTNL